MVLCHVASVEKRKQKYQGLRIDFESGLGWVKLKLNQSFRFSVNGIS